MYFACNPHDTQRSNVESSQPGPARGRVGRVAAQVFVHLSLRFPALRAHSVGSRLLQLEPEDSSLSAVPPLPPAVPVDRVVARAVHQVHGHGVPGLGVLVVAMAVGLHEAIFEYILLRLE